MMEVPVKVLRQATRLDLPMDVKKALLKVRVWCDENGYVVKIFKRGLK